MLLHRRGQSCRLRTGIAPCSCDPMPFPAVVVPASTSNKVTVSSLSNGLATTCTLTARGSNPSGGILNRVVDSAESAASPLFTPGSKQTVSAGEVLAEQVVS